jgi:hypothetical protein
MAKSNPKPRLTIRDVVSAGLNALDRLNIFNDFFITFLFAGEPGQTNSSNRQSGNLSSRLSIRKTFLI